MRPRSHTGQPQGARRRLLAAGLAFSPLMAALSGVAALGGCARDNEWPEGLVAIHWDRDTCTRCRMVISDRRFAVELVGATPQQALKFDDIGCAVLWLRDHAADPPWSAAATTRLWVADVRSRPQQVPTWLDARHAQYLTRSSPMAYNFGATGQPEGGSVDYATMRDHVLARGH